MKSTTIKTLLNSKSVTMAQIMTETQVKTSAANKHVVITKTTNANVQLFSHLNDATVYLNAVKKTAGRIEENSAEQVQNFEQTSAYYTHDDECYSIVTHRKTGKEYLYCIYNNAERHYTVDGKSACPKEVAQYLTPSDAKKLLEENVVVYNKKNDVMHTVVVRTIALENVKKIAARGTIIIE